MQPLGLGPDLDRLDIVAKRASIDGQRGLVRQSIQQPIVSPARDADDLLPGRRADQPLALFLEPDKGRNRQSPTTN